MMYISVINLTIIDSDKGLSPGQRQAIIWTNVGILLIGPLEEIFNQKLYIFIKEKAFGFFLRNGRHFVLASMR